MPWLKVYDDLPRHPKTTRLARKLGAERALVVGCLVCLWSWAFQYAEDGDLKKFTDEDLADAAHWPGDAAEFVAALRSTGWIDKHFIHGWDEHAGSYFYDRNRHRKYLQNGDGSQETPRNLRQSSQLKIKNKSKSKRNPKTLNPLSDKSDVVSLNHDGFDRFWRLYPKKEGKQVAIKRWKKMTKQQRQRATVVAEAITYAVANGYRDIDIVPMGSTFLNQARYEDWYEDDRLVVPVGYLPPDGGPKARARKNQIDRLVEEMERGQT